MCYVDAILARLHYVQFGRTALYSASRNGHLEVVQLLLQWNADVNICDEVCTCTYTAQNYDLIGYLWVIHICTQISTTGCGIFSTVVMVASCKCSCSTCQLYTTLHNTLITVYCMCLLIVVTHY